MAAGALSSWLLNLDHAELIDTINIKLKKNKAPHPPLFSFNPLVIGVFITWNSNADSAAQICAHSFKKYNHRFIVANNGFAVPWAQSSPRQKWTDVRELWQQLKFIFVDLRLRCCFFLLLLKQIIKVFLKFKWSTGLHDCTIKTERNVLVFFVCNFDVDFQSFSHASLASATEENLKVA